MAPESEKAMSGKRTLLEKVRRLGFRESGDQVVEESELVVGLRTESTPEEVAAVVREYVAMGGVPY